MYKEVSATAKKKLAKQLKLAAKPIRVPAHEGRMFDTRYLSDALKGRTDVSKTYGVSYVAMKGVLVLTRQLREWLTLFCQDPNTGDLINIHKWTPENWAFVSRDIDKSDDFESRGKRVLILHFVSEEETLDVTTTFKNQFDNLELDYKGENYKHSPVIHEVILEKPNAPK